MTLTGRALAPTRGTNGARTGAGRHGVMEWRMGEGYWTTRTYGRNWPQIALLRQVPPSVTCYLGGYDRRGRAGATRLSGQLQSGPAHVVRTVFTCPAQENSSPKVGAGCRKRVSPPPGRRVVPPKARVLGAEASSSVHERRRFRSLPAARLGHQLGGGVVPDDGIRSAASSEPRGLFLSSMGTCSPGRSRGGSRPCAAVPGTGSTALLTCGNAGWGCQ